MANVPGRRHRPQQDQRRPRPCAKRRQQIPAYLAQPNQDGNYPGIVVIHGGVRARRPHLRPRPALRQYRLQRDRARPLLAARRPDRPERHQHGVPGHVRLAGQRRRCRISKPRPTICAVCRRHRQNRRDRLLLGRPAHAAVRLQQQQGRCGDRLLGRVHPSRHAGCRDDRRRGRPPSSTWSSSSHCPLFGVFGDEDQNPPVALAEELEEAGAAAGKDVTTKIYKNAGHAFLADYRPSYREGPAFELWNDVPGFFDKHLKS